MRMRGKMKCVQGMMLLAVLAMLSSGCSQTVSAIQNREMTVQAKMSETIFLNPEILEKKKKVFIRFTNTSDAQEVDISQPLRQIITGKGMTVVDKASNADYFVTVNLLYMGLEREDLTADGMLAGGFGGVLAGAAIARNSPGVGGLLGGLGGMAAGAAIGSMFKIDEYVGALDVQIKEPAPKGYKASVTESNNDSSRVSKSKGNYLASNTTTNSNTSKNRTVTTEVDDSRADHRTRIVASAKQTNIDKSEAMKTIASKLATQVGGMF